MRQKKYTAVKTYIAFAGKLFSSYYLKTCTVSEAKTQTHWVIEKSSQVVLCSQACALKSLLLIPYKAHALQVFLDARPIYDRGFTEFNH